ACPSAHLRVYRCPSHRSPVFPPRYTSFFPRSFFNDTAPTEIYTLSLHDALPICAGPGARPLHADHLRLARRHRNPARGEDGQHRSEEHTSELQSRENLVCRLLLEKKKKNNKQ